MLLFLVDLINIEKFRISFHFFYSFSFILRSRATSVYHLTNVKKDKELSIINVTCYYLLLNTFDLICLFINIVNIYSLSFQ